jgi:hypothetical protein
VDFFAESLTSLWQSIDAQALLLYYGLAGLAGIAFALAIYLRFRHRPVTIRIISPAQSAWVLPAYYVHGNISPRRAPLQVFVYSAATAKWHLQAPVEWQDGTRWRALCRFESENIRSGADFKVVAIESREPMSDQLDELPANRQSDIIKVSRR